MISLLRRLVNSTVGKVIFLLMLVGIALSFAMADVTSLGHSFSFAGSRDFAARVDGETMSAADLESAIRRGYRNAQRQNPALTLEQFIAQGGATQVYDEQVSSMTLRAYARRSGLVPSKTQVDTLIASIPAFQDAAGKFSQDAYRTLLQREGYTDKSLREELSLQIIRNQLMAPSISATKFPTDMTVPYVALLLESRSGRIAVVPSELLAPRTAPDAKTLAAFYARNGARFALPEARRLRYAVIDEQRFADAAKPTEAEIAASYRQNQATYGASEKRALRQLILPTEAAARAVADKVRGGQTLSQAAQTTGLAVSDVPATARAALASATSDAIATQAFAAAQGALVGPVKGPLGWQLFEVASILKSPARTLDQVRGEIAGQIAARKEAQLLGDFTGKIDDQIGEGSTFDELAKANGLSVVTTGLLAADGQPIGGGQPADADSRALLRAAFAMEEDAEPQLVPIVADKRIALLDVAEVRASAPPPLDQVRAEVTRAWALDQGQRRARQIAETIRAAVTRGTPLEQALTAAGAPLPPVRPVTASRADIARAGGQVPPALALLFSMRKGSVKALALPQDQGYLLIQLDQLRTTDPRTQPALLEDTRGQLARIAGEEYAEQLARSFEAQVGTERNPAVLAKVIASLRGGAADAQ
jgi:peptidyl-prolyl cis-trans isomerase D